MIYMQSNGSCLSLFVQYVYSEKSYFSTNTSNQIYFSNVRENQSWTTFFLSLHRVLRHGAFKTFAQNVICSLMRVVFITDLVITFVLRWFIWQPTKQNKFILVMLEKINYWQHYFVVYIDFWGMVRSNNFAQNDIYVAKWVMLITNLLITSVLKSFIW